MEKTPQPGLALFDLDGTLTWHDTLMPFLGRYLVQHPWRLFGLWRLPGALLGYALDRERGVLKSRIIRMVMGGTSRAALNRFAERFVGRMREDGRFRPAALAVLERHRRAGDRLVLLSASPDCYVPLVGRLLGFERTLCTELLWRAERLDGRLVTPNRRGEEKLRCLEWLRGEYPQLAVTAYGNSASDLDHMQHAEHALLVNASAGARQRAAVLGVPTGEWR